MAAKFVLKKSGKDKFKFNLKAGNGEIILTSQGYSSKSSAKNGIESVKKNCRRVGNFDQLKSKNGKLYFVLKAANARVIGKSEMYNSASACENGIKSVKTNGPKAAVDDQA